MVRRLRKIAYSSILLCGSLLTTHLQAQAPQEYHIPAQPLNKALASFALATKLELLYTLDRVRQLQAPAVDGVMSPEQALTQLLKNSGLQFRFVDAQIVTIEEASSLIEKSSPAAELPVLEVVGSKVNANQLENIGYQPLTTRSVTGMNAATQSLPQSIQSLNRHIIDDQQAVTMSEVLQNVSGLVPRNPLFANVVEGTYIRGFRAEQLVDGFTQYYNAGDRESTINVEQLDVMKGSNALLYSGGSGAPAGGAINLVSKVPQAEAFDRFSAKAGSFDFYQAALDSNHPLTNTLGFRLTAEYTTSHSMIDTLTTQRFNINPVLQWRPAPETTLNLYGKISRWQQPDYQGLPATGTLVGPFRTDTHLFPGPDNLPDSSSASDAVWGILEQGFANDWHLLLKARYAKSHFKEYSQVLLGANSSLLAEQPYLPPSFWAVANAELSQRQQDISLTANLSKTFRLGGEPQQILLGIDRSQLDDTGFLQANADRSSLVDLSSSHPVFPQYVIPGPEVENQFMNTVSRGAYLQWHGDFATCWHGLLGLRLGGVEEHYQAPGYRYKNNQWAFLPRAGVVFDLHENVSLFASYSQGMRGQPFLQFTGIPSAEFSSQQEAGIKLLWPEFVSAQVAVYQIDRNNVATTNSLGQIVAVGEQRSQGVEVDINAELHPGWKLLFNYANTYAVFLENGNRLPQIPQHNGRLWLDYQFEQTNQVVWNAGVGITLNSGAFVDAANQYKTDDYHSLDAALSYQYQSHRLALSAKNLSNEHYFLPFGYFANGSTNAGGRVIPAIGTTVFLQISTDF